VGAGWTRKETKRAEGELSSETGSSPDWVL